MIPKIVIVGRPNVGKSSLLNLLAGRRVSIVDPTAGVTRDRVSCIVHLEPSDPNLGPRTCEMIDTGGYGIQDADHLTAHVERQIELGLAEAQLILFVVDAQTGVVPLDEEVALLLRRHGLTDRVLLVANKVDGPRDEPSAHEAARLGFGTPIPVSASSGRNKESLVDAILQRLPAEPPGPQSPEAAPDAGVLLAIVGKRNAGKSTLVNALAGQERVIVSETEGTTRDSIDVRFEMDGRVFTAIDTAGVRKTKSLKGDIEFYSRHRTLRSIRRADVVLLLIDAAVPVSQVDKQLVNEILKHHKPCLIVLNKWDLVEAEHTPEEYVKYLDSALEGLRFGPVAFVSAKHGQGLREAVATALSLHEQAGRRVTTGQLNRAMEQVFAERLPHSGTGRRPKVYYATQLAVHPPTIGLFVNDPALFDAAYQRFLINRFRTLLPFAEVPIKLIIRGRRSLPAEASSAASRED